VRCNAVLPGWIMTEMFDEGFALAGDPDAAVRDALARHPAGRFGSPADIANVVAWLVSEEASWATGQCFTVDGGLTAASPLRPESF
jgi:NAD(P)-dependent dehydrogenase (short-subunit alcohol dehydrogenase family)